MLRSKNIEIGLMDGAMGIHREPFKHGRFFYENARRIGYNLEEMYRSKQTVDDQIYNLKMELEELKEMAVNPEKR